MIKLHLEYKRLESGYHYVVSLNHHHLFAQWPVGQRCKAEDVSGIPLSFSCGDFADQAQRLADSAKRS